MIATRSITLRGNTWSIKDYRPTGAILWIFWIVEAGLIIGAAVVVGLRAAPAGPLCEHCDQWCKLEPDVVRLAPPQSWSLAEDLRTRAEAKDRDWFARECEPPEGGAWVQLGIWRCRHCSKLHTLDISVATLEIDSEGGVSTRQEPILRDLLLSPADVGVLRQLQYTVEQKAAAARPAEHQD